MCLFLAKDKNLLESSPSFRNTVAVLFDYKAGHTQALQVLLSLPD